MFKSMRIPYMERKYYIILTLENFIYLYNYILYSILTYMKILYT